LGEQRLCRVFSVSFEGPIARYDCVICEIWPTLSAEFRKITKGFASKTHFATNKHKKHTEFCVLAHDLPSLLPAILKVIFNQEALLMTLDKTPVGSTVRIISLESSDIVAVRLMEMGMVPGSTARIVKAAPLGDPIQICLRNYHLVLRRNEARAITVAICD